MQPSLAVGILVLQAKGLVWAIHYLVFLFQTALAGMVTKSHEVAVFIGHLTRDTDLVAVEVVGLLVAFASERVAFYGNAAVVVAFAVAALKHFAVGVVTVVFVAGYKSAGMVVFDHNVVAVGETAHFFAVASVNGGQIAVAKIDFGKQQPCAAVRGGDLVEVV